MKTYSDYLEETTDCDLLLTIYLMEIALGGEFMIDDHRYENEQLNRDV